RAAAGQDQIAETRQPGHGLAPGTKASAKAHHLGEASRAQRAMRAPANLLAADAAGGAGVDVLEPPADLGAGDVIAPIAAERGMAQGMRKRADMRFAHAWQVP